MRLLVSGSRNYGLNLEERNDIIEAIEDVIIGPYVDLVIIHGCATGVDSVAGYWAMLHGVEVLEYPAEWDTYGKSAGPIRNGRMLKEGQPDLVLAFTTQYSKGTKNMIKQAIDAGIPVKVINF